MSRLLGALVGLTVTVTGCSAAHQAVGQGDDRPARPTVTQDKAPGRGFPVAGPWASFYGQATDVDLDRVARTYRIINIDADPDAGDFTAAQISRLKAGGRNRVISYLNLGAVEKSRSYWSHAPKGLIPAGQNHKAQLGPYHGYPDEIWMNPCEPQWQRLILDYIAPRLVKQGVDGFYFDNLEVIEHSGAHDEGHCDARCAQGGLDLVDKLRERFPKLSFVMQNATGDQTLDGRTSNGVAFPTLLDGVAHEDTFTTPSDADNSEDSVYTLSTDSDAVNELKAWQRRNGHDFWVATEDYVNSCGNTRDAAKVLALARAQGFSPYVSDKSADQNTVCYWPGR